MTTERQMQIVARSIRTSLFLAWAQTNYFTTVYRILQ